MNIPDIQNSIDSVIKYGSTFLTVIGSFYVLWLKAMKKNKEKRTERNSLINSGIEQFKDYAEIRSFLEDVRIQEYFIDLLGFKIRQCDIKPVLEFLKDGKCNISDIKDAWAYKKISEDQLSFELDLHGKITLWGNRIFTYTIVTIASLSCFYAVYLNQALPSFIFFMIAFLMLFVSIVPIIASRSEIAVIRIQKMKNS
jgi:hypothetical protein